MVKFGTLLLRPERFIPVAGLLEVLGDSRPHLFSIRVSEEPLRQKHLRHDLPPVLTKLL
ncbi:hypothetical protein GA0070563_10217 [Micromonospora carbonacea]|uniref:Uncharacterized protein n=1 Tax=Micromonospora carbonacea TaxID=47853 RepID=A0A1C4V438_9ACTN|nr:hypothetical protein GA0070563_10217 [Micromonospora carbonacea]